MKKSLFKTALSWFTGQTEQSSDSLMESARQEEKVPPAEAVASASVPPAVKIPWAEPGTTPAQMPAPTPAPNPAPVAVPPPSAPRVRRVEVDHKPPEPTPVPLNVAEGPELRLVSRGAAVYGTCPHCEATWNVRERLTVVSFKKVEKTLTCPACSKPVSIPQSK